MILRLSALRLAVLLGSLVGLAIGAALPAARAASDRAAFAMVTGRVLDQPQMKKSFNAVVPIWVGIAIPMPFSVDHYAQVDSRWLPGYMSRFRADLSRLGVPGALVRGQTDAPARFNRANLADLFVAHAGAELMTALWRSDLPAQRPAMLVAWYVPDRRPAVGRAVVLVYTEAGLKWWDPQSGEVHLSATEMGSIYHRHA